MRRFTRARVKPSRRVAYLPGSERVGDLYLPARAGGPVVVLIHGGYWRLPWGRNLMHALAAGLVGGGLAVYNIEYRRLGSAGGGWPGTLTDVAAALDQVAAIPEVDFRRVAVMGHSAGGQLALWGLARHRLEMGCPGADPAVRPRAAVALAAVSDLAQGARDGLGGGAVEELLGGTPAQVPERYRAASPTALLPLGRSQLLIHGRDDDTVPLSQSVDYVRRATGAGDPAILEVIEGDHFDVIDPATLPWAWVMSWLDQALAPP